MDMDADYWIENLQLRPHVEGGAFREVYRSALTIENEHPSAGVNTNRNICTSIYFLLKYGDFSAFHRIRSDELWHFHFGQTLTIYEIEAQTGSLKIHFLGPQTDKGEVFQTAVKAGNWFAAIVKGTGAYALAGCTVAPGFDYADFELGNRDQLSKTYPQHQRLIISLTR
jgi:predicted cupin superfamily sugar epimerase